MIFRAMRIVIAGGGTGGHLFPGIAIAREFLSRNPETRVLFISKSNPSLASVLSKAGVMNKSITVEGIKGKGVWRQALSISKIPGGVFESILILKRFKPDLAIGVGGYVAGPVIAGARILKIKTALHEQNVLPGLTNRILSRFVDRIYVSFNNTKTFLCHKKVLVTGNPVRKEILRFAGGKENIKGADLREKQIFSVLIMGGSQGAHSINMAMIKALEKIKEKNRFFFAHQTGIQDEKNVRNAYLGHGISCDVQPFFNDMAQQYQKADLIICRAGATTVAEITAVGKGAIFIPYPFAADNHQMLNAGNLSNAGAAEMIIEKDLNGSVIADRINYYASNPDTIEAMVSKARSFGKSDAAKSIVDDCYKLTGI